MASRWFLIPKLTKLQFSILFTYYFHSVWGDKRYCSPTILRGIRSSFLHECNFDFVRLVPTNVKFTTLHRSHSMRKHLADQMCAVSPLFTRQRSAHIPCKLEHNALRAYSIIGHPNQWSSRGLILSRVYRIISESWTTVFSLLLSPTSSLLNR